MGFSHWVVAVAGLPPEDLAGRLGHAMSDRTATYETAVTSETPGLCVSPAIGGWTFLIGKDARLLPGDDALSRLSEGTRVLTLFVEEHSMSFETSCWTGGTYTWAVIAYEGLFVIGDPPPPFGELVGALREGEQVVSALNELTGPPEEMWEELGFDPAGMPAVRAAALGLPVRAAEPAPRFGVHTYLPAVVIFERLTGHGYDGNDPLHHASFGVLAS
ncbi:hypothetical protein [Actinomadura sp. DC4]|uniref:hypothetical protein n=1 Tax=Actinomadura sp. DC4 TaxID=3055069 RepID=UPI0025AF0E87|nr:hypothetical protein [Actinomadura sp. DC4]MDN3356573.1 hypothetical protein [Actinomadura sp. DC4]